MAADSDHDSLADALLFNAARRQLLAEVVEPALAASAVVICDRYADSTLAYQGFGAGAQLDVLRRVANAATGGLTPDRTVLLDLPIAVGLERRFGAEAEELTRFETGAAFDREFHERVRAGFLELAALEPDRWRVVDASRAPEDVAEEVWSAVADLF
jgi:dTMP kinase